MSVSHVMLQNITLSPLQYHRLQYMTENTFVVPVVPVPTPQCIDVDEVHAGNRLSLMVTPGGSEEWVRNIATEFTPTIGQTFATLDEGIQFYETYAIAYGFEPRKSSTKRFRSSGDIRTKLIVCHREGFRDSKPTILPITGEEEESMVKAYNPKKTKVTRIGCKARIFFKFVIKEIDQVQVPLFVVDQFHAAHNHRLSPLKYREFQKKCRNLALQHKQTIVDNCKVNIGPTSTFRSVKEYVDGYENIGASLTDFKNFGREIKCFIGLKDAQMFVDQLETLHETQEGFYYAYDIDQNKCLFRVFWADAVARRNYALYGEAVTFDPTYSTNKYDMIFAPFTGVDHHKKSVTFGASLISRENDQNFKWIFTKFLDFFGDSSREGKSTRFLEVEDSIFNKTYTVAFNPSTFDATCSCKLFERKGYICKHIIWILSGKGIKKIPDKYLLSRWTKNTKKMPLYDVHGQLLDDFTSSDVTKLKISTVWSEFYSTLTLLKSLP
ncbi:protein FAR1-RELATED SEQUENCE 5-like [Silene latifolia]|uniref:protein FAR1-RELATED SEQUENCE 5-like n=1 Tax=Silene latifolia TaxID=37657 RepID=UPI003D77DCFE